MGEIKTISQGEESHNMVLILEGEETRKLLTSFQIGYIVGEMEFLTGETRTASVVIQSETAVRVIIVKVTNSNFKTLG